MILGYVKAFLVGAVLCMIGQILIDKTELAPARILTLYVVAGVVLGAVGVYGPFAKWAGAGATVPLTGFGNLLAKGVREAVAEKGVLGAFTGGFEAGAAGICAAIFFGLLVAMCVKSKAKPYYRQAHLARTRAKKEPILMNRFFFMFGTV